MSDKQPSVAEVRRFAMGLTREDVAQRMGVSTGTVAYIENSQASPKQICGYLDALQLVPGSEERRAAALSVMPMEYAREVAGE